MIKYRTNCITCQLSKKDGALRKRIYYAAFKRDSEDESLNMIASEFDIPKQSIYKHVKNHLTEAVDKTEVINAKKIAQVQGQVAKELELSFDHNEVLPKEDYEQGMDDVIAKGLADMKTTNKVVTVNQLLAAIKIKAEYKSKKRGQDVEVLKTVYQTIKKDGIRTPTNVS